MTNARLEAFKPWVLVDTSVWVEFIRFGNAQLSALLRDGHVLVHDMVIGEIACGSAANCSERLSVMKNLPKVTQAEHSEVLTFIERHQLFGRGVGYVDNHLLAATVLHGEASLWSRDKRLLAAATQLGIAFEALAH